MLQDLLVRLGTTQPATSHHYINMEYAPLLCVKAEALGFLLIARLLLILKGVLMELQIVALAIFVE